MARRTAAAAAIAGGALLFAVAPAFAKYVQPADGGDLLKARTDYMMHELDKDGDGKLSPGEFAGQAETRESRREKRRLEKRDEEYLPPEELFKKLDDAKAEDDATKGYLTPGQLREYLEKR